LLTGGAVVLGTPETFGIADRAAASRALLLVCAGWWAAFAVPLFLYVPEPERDTACDLQERPVRASFERPRDTYREVRTYRVTFIFLAGFFFTQAVSPPSSTSPRRTRATSASDRPR